MHRFESNDNLEDCVCPLCGQQSYSVYMEFSPFRIVRCKCGMYFENPRLTESEMLKFYQNESYYSDSEVGYQNYAAQESTLCLTFRKLMKNLEERRYTGGVLLEVGCGYVFLLG